MFKLITTTLEVPPIQELMSSPSAGAFNCFEGRVRNVNHNRDVIALEYEADEALCNNEAEKILNEAKEKFGVINAVCIHRIGRLNVGEMAVWIGVIAGHRDASFKACRYIIDEIKARLPIWKKEYYADGDSGWVNCECLHHMKINEPRYYSRQMNLKDIGPAGQQKLMDAKVLVVGAGGLGSAVLQGLAGAGVGVIGICEHDTLDEANLHRQTIYNHTDIGLSKAGLAGRRVKEINPSVEVDLFSEKISTDNAKKIINRFDVVIDCTDNFSAKFLLNDACYLLRKPLIQSSIYQYDGQVHTLLPGQRGCLRCQWPDIPQEGCVGNCAEAGVLGVLPSVFGSLQALEALKYICGLGGQLNDTTLIMNLRDYTQSRIKREINARCPLCSDQPTVTTLKKENYMADASELEVSIDKLVNEGLDKFTFIDVREQTELFLEPVNEIEAEHRPMSTMTPENFEIDDTKNYIVFCAKGVRSYQVCDHFTQQGKTNLRSLAGGVDAIRAYFENQGSSH